MQRMSVSLAFYKKVGNLSLYESKIFLHAVQKVARFFYQKKTNHEDWQDLFIVPSMHLIKVWDFFTQQAIKSPAVCQFA